MDEEEISRDIAGTCRVGCPGGSDQLRPVCHREVQLGDDGQLAIGFGDLEAVCYSDKGLWCRGRKQSLSCMGSREL